MNLFKTIIHCQACGGYTFKKERLSNKINSCRDGNRLICEADIRKESPTYVQWEGYVLSESYHRQLLVPKGVTHGFVALTPNVNFLYKCDNYYNTETDERIAFDDPDLAIDWTITKEQAIHSKKDQHHLTL